MIFPIPKSCYKIINRVYENNGIKVSRLLRETSVSQKIGYQHLQELVKADIVKDESIGSLRIIKPNLESETGKLIFGLIEKEKEFDLLELAPQLKDSLNIIKSKASDLSINSLVLFGGLVKNGGKDKIDMLVISESEDKRIVPFLKDCFSNVENAVSARIISSSGFKRFKETKIDLFQAMFSNHVCVYGTQNFITLLR